MPRSLDSLDSISVLTHGDDSEEIMVMVRKVALTVTDTMTHFRPTTRTGKTCQALLGLLASLAFCPVPAVAQEAGFTLQGFIYNRAVAETQLG